MTMSRLEEIRSYLYLDHGCPCQGCKNGRYLLSIIDLQAKQIEAATISTLDPDNDDDTSCYCVSIIQDDQGHTVQSSYNPLCPTHGTHKDPVL